MGRDGRTPIPYVIGPDGELMTRHDLPAPDIKRWVSRRKAEVVLAVEGGLLSMEEACRRYSLTVEEFVSWEHGLERHGLNGLKASRAQQYRSERMRQKPAQPRHSSSRTFS